MSQRAGGPIWPIELFGKRDRIDHVSRFRRLDRDEVLRRLRGSKQDPAEMAEIRRWSYEQGFGVSRTDEQLLAKIAQAACDGHIVLSERRTHQSRSGIVGGGGHAKSEEPAKERDRSSSSATTTSARHSGPVSTPPTPMPPAVKTKTWIEFRLLDEITGEPITGVTFRIELTDGAVVNRMTDGSGLIRIDEIDPGTCGIREIAEDTGSEVTTVT